MKRKSLTLTVCAALTALTFILGWIPYGGPFLLPMLFAACCFSVGISFFASIMFGAVSLLLSYIMGPTTAVGWFFITYQWVPVVARMFIGPIVHFLFKGLTKLVKSGKAFNRILPISIAGAVGSVLNTFFVGLFLLTLDKSGMPAGLTPLGVIELVIFGSIELVVNAVLLPPIVLGVKRAMPRLFAEINGTKVKTPADEK